MLTTKFRFIWQSGFREDFIKSGNQKEELPVSAMCHFKQYFSYIVVISFSSPCQRQYGLLPSLGVRPSLTFHILIFSSEIRQPNELK
jgi:hypothetical protein